jgi:WD40 repeat protein
MLIYFRRKLLCSLSLFMTLMCFGVILRQSGIFQGGSIQKGHTHDILFVGWAPDGDLLVSYSWGDGTIKLWEPQSGRLLWDIKVGDLSPIAELSSPDGKILASGERKVGFQLREAASGRLLWDIKANEDHSSAVSPDGTILAEGGRWGDACVRLINVQTKEVIRRLEAHPGIVQALAFNPKNHVVASGSSDRTIKLWEARTGKLILSLEGHSKSVAAVAYSHSGNLLISGSEDGTLKIWNANDGSLIRDVEVRTEGIADVSAVAFSHDDQIIVTACGVKVKVWSAINGQLLHTLETHESHTSRDSHGLKMTWCCGSEIGALAFSPDGKVLASGHADGTIKLWDPKRGLLRRTIRRVGSDIRTIDFSPDGKILASGNGNDRAVAFWDVATSKRAGGLGEDSESVYSLSFSPDGSKIVTGDIASNVRLWNVKGRKLIREFDARTGDVKSVAFSPDGRLIAAGGINQNIQVWDEASGELIWELSK